jgi:hypothetical protein
MIALLASAAIFAPLGGHPLLDTVTGAFCKPIGALQTSAPVTPTLLYRKGDPGKVKRLDTLPKANHEKAVLRTVDGCAAPMVVGYAVQGDGRFAASAGGGK